MIFIILSDVELIFCFRKYQLASFRNMEKLDLWPFDEELKNKLKSIYHRCDIYNDKLSKYAQHCANKIDDKHGEYMEENGYYGDIECLNGFNANENIGILSLSDSSCIEKENNSFNNNIIDSTHILNEEINDLNLSDDEEDNDRNVMIESKSNCNKSKKPKKPQFIV